MEEERGERGRWVTLPPVSTMYSDSQSTHNWKRAKHCCQLCNTIQHAKQIASQQNSIPKGVDSRYATPPCNTSLQGATDCTQLVSTCTLADIRVIPKWCGYTYSFSQLLSTCTLGNQPYLGHTYSFSDPYLHTMVLQLIPYN
jgi:hypothetical protein